MRKHIEYVFEADARKASEVLSYDEERKRAFMKGARWLAEQLLTQIRPGIMANMIDKGTQRYLDGLKLKSIEEILYVALASKYVEAVENDNGK